MTDKTRKAIGEYFKEIFLFQASNETIEFIHSKVRMYNRSKLPGEPEITFEEMKDLVIDKLAMGGKG